MSIRSLDGQLYPPNDVIIIKQFLCVDPGYGHIYPVPLNVTPKKSVHVSAKL